MDLLQTGKFGVLANQQLLGTTSNNITNVNTDGYVRQDTRVYTNAVDWGIGSIVTRRMYDKYVQREMFRDQGNVGFYDAYSTGLSTVDNLLSNDDTSIATSLNDFFSSMQSAVQNTTSVANRRELLTQLQNMVDRFESLNYNINNELTDINNKIGDTASTINSLVKSFYEVNRQIRGLVGSNSEQSDIGLQLMDQRDQLVNQLSEYVDINVTTEKDGTYALYLGNGQLLANGETYANLTVNKDPNDNTRRTIDLTFEIPSHTTLTLGSDCWGGRLGGYLNAADEIRQSKRDLGQLALAFADAMNEQNKGGITLENKAGRDLITIPSVQAHSSNTNFSMTVTFDQGEGSDIRNCDYQVIVNDAGAIEVYTTYGDGKYTKIDESLLHGEDVDSKFVLEIEGHGITMTFNKTADEIKAEKGLQFYAQPTVNAAYDISCNITKPEEFAFASAIRVNTNKHAGNATASLVGVTNTGEGMGIQYDETTGLPKFSTNADGNIIAPNYIQYYEGDADNPAGYYCFAIDPEKGFDDEGNPVNKVDINNALGYAPADCNGENIFANTIWEDPQPAAGFPGYDVSFVGTVVNGSSFQIEINENGSNDNSNGNLLAQLQQENLVSSRTSTELKVGFTESYADLTATVGSAVMSATTDLAAAQAKCTQSQTLFSSVAGVNLDEEAAQLVRFQQSYSACSKIISASQTVFDALISVM